MVIPAGASAAIFLSLSSHFWPAKQFQPCACTYVHVLVINCTPTILEVLPAEQAAGCSNAAPAAHGIASLSGGHNDIITAVVTVLDIPLGAQTSKCLLSTKGSCTAEPAACSACLLCA